MEKVVNKLKQLNLKSVLSYVLMFVVFFVCNKASINQGYLTPFCFGPYYALVFKGGAGLVISVVFTVAFMLANFSLSGLGIVLNYVLVALMFKFVHKLIKKQAPKLLVCFYALIGSVFSVVAMSGSAKDVVLALVSVVVGLVFLYCCLIIADLKNKNIKAKLSVDELICLGALVCVLSMGVASLNIGKIETFKIVGSCLILVLSYVCSMATMLTTSALFGLGVGLHFSNATFVAVFVLMALCAVGFKSSYKIIACLAIILCEVVFGLYFISYSSFTVYSLISVVCGELIFLFIPLKVLNGLSCKINGINKNVGVRGIVNRARENLCKRMREVGNVFLEMDMVYRQMVRGVLPEADAKKMILDELYSKCCKDCPNRTKCFRINANESHEVFNNVIDVGFEKGKLNLLDVPQYLTVGCVNVNRIITTLNNLLKSYKQYVVLTNNMDASKILIADQLKGVSGIMNTLSEEVNLNIVYDVETENRLKEELNYKNICCLEALVYNQTTSVNFVSLILAGKFDKAKLEKVVSKVVGVKMCVDKVLDGGEAGTQEVVLKTRANFDVVFGCAAQTKTGKVLSGDTHSLIKIDDGKYMVALCDGMGSGEEAHKVSDLTITLIENFYKAGFENEIILNSVNKLLSLNESESFSALDVCVLDLRKSLMDFIKLGSPCGFIKHKTETEIVESGGLPIGVL